MSDLVGNPKDRFCHDAADIVTYKQTDSTMSIMVPGTTPNVTHIHVTFSGNINICESTVSVKTKIIFYRDHVAFFLGEMNGLIIFPNFFEKQEICLFFLYTDCICWVSINLQNTTTTILGV